jgi:hypothetical protein
MMHRPKTGCRISTNMNRDSEVCDRMFKSVVCRVERFEISRSERRTFGYSALSVIAALALIPIVIYMVESANRSGFGGYLSLIASDSSYVFTHWKEFVLPTASSLPIMGVTIILLALLVFVMSLRRTGRFSAYSEIMRKRLIANV